MAKTCQIEDCEGEVSVRGWCNKHYLRWRRHGDPLTVKQHQLHGLTEQERFARRIDVSDDPDECWEWTGARTVAGYGHFTVHPDGRTVHQYAHRRAYEQANGPIPDGWEVCHKCDNPPCCNPDHLFVGTHADNLRDMANKGRNPGNGGKFGTRHHSAKLNPAKVRDIRRRHAAGATGRSLADQYGVSESTISHVVSKKTWRHVAETDEQESR